MRSDAAQAPEEAVATALYVEAEAALAEPVPDTEVAVEMQARTETEPAAAVYAVSEADEAAAADPGLWVSLSAAVPEADGHSPAVLIVEEDPREEELSFCEVTGLSEEELWGELLLEDEQPDSPQPVAEVAWTEAAASWEQTAELPVAALAEQFPAWLQLHELQEILISAAAIDDSAPLPEPAADSTDGSMPSDSMAPLELLLLGDPAAVVEEAQPGLPVPLGSAGTAYGLYGIRVERTASHAPLLSVGLDETPIDRLPDVPFKFATEVPRASREMDDEYECPPAPDGRGVDKSAAKSVKKPREAEEPQFPGKHEAPKPSGKVVLPEGYSSFGKLSRLSRWLGGLSGGKQK